MEPRAFSLWWTRVLDPGACSHLASSRLALAVVLLALAGRAPALAQSQEPDPWESARWRFGPFAVTPRVELKNLGWDSNVFNETEDPKSSFTTTVGAPIDWWLRFGRARLHGVDYFEGVYFGYVPEPEQLQPAPRPHASRPAQPHPPVRRRLLPQHQRPAGLRNRRAPPPHRDAKSTRASVIRLTSQARPRRQRPADHLQVRRRGVRGNAVLDEAQPPDGEVRRPGQVQADAAHHPHPACRQRPRAVFGVSHPRQRRVPDPARRRVRPVRAHSRQGAGRLPEASTRFKPACPTFRGLSPTPSCRTPSAA